MCLAGCPHFGLSGIFVDDVVKVEFESFNVRLLYSLENIEDDRSESIFVEVDFLVIWNLSYLAKAEVSITSFKYWRRWISRT
jgi:hypothetical protein